MDTTRWCPTCETWVRFPEGHVHATGDALLVGLRVSGLYSTGFARLGWSQTTRVLGTVVAVSHCGFLSIQVDTDDGRRLNLVGAHARPDSPAARTQDAVRAALRWVVDSIADAERRELDDAAWARWEAAHG